MAKQTKIHSLIQKAKETREKNFPDEINFYFTEPDFPAVSITGPTCSLNCKHCQRKIIQRLPGATTPDELTRICDGLDKRGARGILITGGCTTQGKVPLADFLPAIKEIKQRTNLKVIAHTGIMDLSEAKSLAETGIDGVCVDVVGSKEVTKRIYGISIGPEIYMETLSALQKSGIKNISPHVCVGLDYGKTGHETVALEIISSITPTSIVLIGLTDQVETPMEGIKIKPEDFVEVLCKARLMFPNTHISLGCARGKGRIRSEIDRLSIRAGTNSIAIPTKAAYDEAKKLGLAIHEYRSCCSMLPSEQK